MKDKLEQIKTEAKKEFEEVKDEVNLQNVKARFIGRKGLLTEVLKEIPEPKWGSRGVKPQEEIIRSG